MASRIHADRRAVLASTAAIFLAEAFVPVAAFAAPPQPSMVQAPAPAAIHHWTPGIVSIGDGSTSFGVVNASSFQSAGAPDPAKALAAALALGSRVQFLAGDYFFVSPFHASRGGLRIDADPKARFVVANSSPVGLFDLGGDDVALDGLAVEIATPVGDQVAIRMTGQNAAVRHCRFEVTTRGADPAHPMVVLGFEGAVRKSVLDNRWLPNAGVTCLRSVDGNGLSFIGNEIGNGVDGGFPEGWGTPRSCYRGIDLVRDEWCTISSNKFFGLGAPDVDKVDSILRYQGDASTEGGHLVVNGNHIEAIACDRMIELRACRWFALTGNIIGPATGFADAEGEAAIVIVGEDGAEGGLRSAQGIISGNDIHNSALEETDGCAIYLRGADRIAILANLFDFQRAKHVVRVDSDTCSMPSISGNTFFGWPGLGPAPLSPILFSDEPCDGLFVGGNDYYGFSGPVAAGNPAGTRLFTKGLMDRATGAPAGAATQVDDLTTNCDLNP